MLRKKTFYYNCTRMLLYNISTVQTNTNFFINQFIQTIEINKHTN